MESDKKTTPATPFDDRRSHKPKPHKVPAEACRRNSKQFKNKHWWLEVDYTQVDSDLDDGREE